MSQAHDDQVRLAGAVAPMPRYRPNYFFIAIMLISVVPSLLVTTLFVESAVEEERYSLFIIAGFLLLFAYPLMVPLLGWPLAIRIDRSRGHIRFCYLLYRRTFQLDCLVRCSVCEAITIRSSHTTYILGMKGGAEIVLSEINIAGFPGPFAYNIGLDVSTRVPRFVPGFRWFSHKWK